MTTWVLLVWMVSNGGAYFATGAGFSVDGFKSDAACRAFAAKVERSEALTGGMTKVYWDCIEREDRG